MMNEFLRRINRVQGVSLFGNDIKAKAMEMVRAKEDMVTGIVNRTAKELDLLAGSSDIRTIDEKIEKLRNHPSVIEGSKGVMEMAKRANEISRLVFEKEEMYASAYNSAIMSLGGIDGDEATRAINLIARKQKLTNAGLDKIADEIDLQVKRQSAYQSAVISNEKLKELEYNKEQRDLIDKAIAHMYENPTYQTATDLVFNKSSRDDLVRYEKMRTNIINSEFEYWKNENVPVTRKMLEDAYATANLYSGKYTRSNAPDLTKEQELDKSTYINNLNIYSQLIREAGGIDNAKKMLTVSPDDDMFKAGAKYQMFAPGSVYRNLLESVLVGKNGAAGLWDTNYKLLAKLDPRLNEVKSIQNELRQENFKEGRIIPPLLDAQISNVQVPVNSEYANMFLMRGPIGLNETTTLYDPFKVKDLSEEINESVNDNTTYSHVKDDNSSGRGFIITSGAYSRYIDIGAENYSAKEDELEEWQKLSNVISGLRNDEIPDKSQKEEFDKAYNDIINWYNTNTNNKFTPAPEKSKTIVNGIDYAKVTKSAAKRMQQFEAPIRQVSDYYNIDYDLYRKIIYRESKGKVNAVSNKKVYGLTQMTKDTFNLLLDNGYFENKKITYQDYKKEAGVQLLAGGAYIKYLKEFMINQVPESIMKDGKIDKSLLDDAILIGYNSGHNGARRFMNYVIEDFGNKISMFDLILAAKNDDLIRTYILRDSVRKLFNKNTNASYNASTWKEKVLYPYNVDNDYEEAFGNAKGE